MRSLFGARQKAAGGPSPSPAAAAAAAAAGDGAGRGAAPWRGRLPGQPGRTHGEHTALLRPAGCPSGGHRLADVQGGGQRRGVPAGAAPVAGRGDALRWRRLQVGEGDMAQEDTCLLLEHTSSTTLVAAAHCAPLSAGGVQDRCTLRSLPCLQLLGCSRASAGRRRLPSSASRCTLWRCMWRRRRWRASWACATGEQGLV